MEIDPIAAALGAEIRGLDLRGLDETISAAVRAALLEHKVVGFRDQHLTDAEHVDLARALGEPWIHPMDRLMDVDTAEPSELRVRSDHQLRTDEWHLDVMYAPNPPAFGILRAVDVPPYGGDTMWSNLELAADELDDELRGRLAGRATLNSCPETLIALKGPQYPNRDARTVWEDALIGVEQPLLRRHPETGKVAVFGMGPETAVTGLDEDASRALMTELTAHATNLNFTCRWRWRNGDVVIWDERCTAHYAVRDPWPGERVLRRLLVEGDRPVPADIP